ncbi:hypothetical protein UlMin_034887 [Ulmus minor]
MVQKFLTLCPPESKRLIWITGLIFALFLVFQYFELPYGNLLPSLSSVGKFPALGKGSLQNGDSPTGPEIIGNVSDAAQNGTDAAQNIVNQTRTSGFEPEGNGDSDRSSKSSSGNLAKQNQTSPTPENVKNVDNKFAPEEVKETEKSLDWRFNTTLNSSSIGRTWKESNNVTSDLGGSSDTGFPFPSPAVAESTVIAPTTSGNSNISLVNRTTSSEKKENSEQLLDKSPSVPLIDKQPQTNILPEIKSQPEKLINNQPQIKSQPEMPILDVYSISDMNNLLLQSHASYFSVIPQWSSAVDHELHDVALQIENAPIVENDPNLYAPLYRNVSMFRRSYELMEEILKVYVYREGDRPILHTPILKGLYASEGWFMKQLESNRQFVTKNPRKAHLFYLPFSSRMLEETLYVPNSHSHKNLIQYLKNYVDLVSTKYPHWNRTGGADHFLVACHDWAPTETKEHMGKCIRALCNADIKEGFVFGKDVSLPETYVRLPKNPLRDLGGKPLSKKSTLAFFAGSMHGYLRPILLQHWQNKDPDMKIFGKLPKSKNNKNYVNYMKTSKYCICAKGFEVNSPRVVEAILYECVPVIISDNFVPPFFEVLNWESFAVFVLEKDIPNLKNILISIPEKRYRQMQMRVKRVQQHFLWHPKPVKYDIFHMILHSVWYNRIHQIKPI